MEHITSLVLIFVVHIQWKQATEISTEINVFNTNCIVLLAFVILNSINTSLLFKILSSHYCVELDCSVPLFENFNLCARSCYLYSRVFKNISYNKIKNITDTVVILTHHASQYPRFHFLTACYTLFTTSARSAQEHGLNFLQSSSVQTLSTVLLHGNVATMAQCGVNRDTAPMGHYENYVHYLADGKQGTWEGATNSESSIQLSFNKGLL